jgi:hypothetical protein
MLEKVKCNCPEYKGSDFWNDPHRWCDRDAEHERIWDDKPGRDCERTYRPVKAKEAVEQALGLQQTGMQNYLGNFMRTQSELGIPHLQMQAMRQEVGLYDPFYPLFPFGIRRF